MHLVLIGYRGSGKTSVGRALAARLGLEWDDLDQRVVQRAGKSIAEIFRDHGEAAFRDMESAELLASLASPARVISAGGGAFVREANRAALQKSPHRVIYLRCEPAELWRRIEADRQTASSRPALTALGGGLEEITRVLAEREPIYRSILHHEIDVTRLSFDQVVERLAELWNLDPSKQPLSSKTS